MEYLKESAHFKNTRRALESGKAESVQEITLDELIRSITSMRSYCRMGMWAQAAHVAWMFNALVLMYSYQHVEIEPLNAYDDAVLAVTGERNKNYGDCYDNFKNIADLEHRTTTTINERPITPEYVALNMMCVKVSRLMHTHDHYDSLVDLIGYTLCLLQILQHREDSQLLVHEKVTDKLPEKEDE